MSEIGVLKLKEDSFLVFGGIWMENGKREANQ